MRTYKQNGARIIEAPVKDFSVAVVDAAKRRAATAMNYCNGGFFGNYGAAPRYTLPVAHLAADYRVSDPRAKGYCEERGAVTGGRLRYPCGSWDTQFYGKAVSTFCIADGAAAIRAVKALPPCDYAIPGIPVLRAGKPVSLPEVRAEGWDASPLRATYHIFLGLRADRGSVYAVGLKTTGGNLISSGEAARKLAALGLVDAIKLDGGGSYYVHAGGVSEGTSENRRINTILIFGGNPYPTPTRALRRGKRGNDVRWLQWELADKGCACAVDGAFGTGTETALRAFQRRAGLEEDGSCGSATRKKLTE